MQNLGKACLWLDETITYDHAIASIPEIIRASYGWEVHPPTYYLILHFMVKFGESPASVSTPVIFACLVVAAACLPQIPFMLEQAESKLFVPLLFAWIVSVFIYFSGTFRYLLYLNAPLLLLLTLAITTAADKIASAFPKIASRMAANPARGGVLAMAVVLGIFCLVDAYVLANYYRNPRTADWQTGFSYLKKNCQEGDAIVPLPGDVTYIARYFLLGDENSRRVMWLHDLKPPVLDSLITQHQEVYFILSSDFDNPARQEIEAWLGRQTQLLWQDPNFRTNAIWFANRRSALPVLEQPVMPTEFELPQK